MSNLYTGQHGTSTLATEVPKKAMTKKRKYAFVAAVAAVLVGFPLAAWAAVALFGFGSFDSAAATTQNLTVDNSTAVLTSGLTPGNTVGAKADVKNPNNFPVTVTGVIVRNSTLTTTASPTGDRAAQADCNATVQPVGTAATFPGTSEAGTKQAIAANVVIPPGATRTVTIPAAVKQLDTATHLCGVHADFAVVAQTAS